MMSEKSKPKVGKNEEVNQNTSKKRKLSTNNSKEGQTGPEGHSLLDSLKLGGEGDRMPVELFHESNDSKSETKKLAASETIIDTASPPEDR